MVAQSGHAVADDLMSDPVIRREPLVRQDPVTEMTIQRNSQIRRAPNASGLYDVLDLILDKGMVIDAFVRVSLVGIEILTIDLRVVIASVDTYLRYAEGAERLQVYTRTQAKKLPDMVGQGMKGQAMKKGAQKLKETVTGGDDDESEEDQGEQGDEGEQQEEGLGSALTKGVRHILKKGVGGILHKVAGSREEDDEGEDQGEEEDSGDEPEAREQPERRHRGDREGRERKDGNPSRAKAGSRR